MLLVSRGQMYVLHYSTNNKSSLHSYEVVLTCGGVVFSCSFIQY